MKRIMFACAVLAAMLTAGCVSSPLGRSQLILVDDAQIAQMGTTAFAELRKQGEFANAPNKERFARCVSQALIGVLPRPYNTQDWEVQIIEDDSANAFALPGGKIGVNTGMFRIADTQAELATVLSHELAHIVARHPAERVSDRYAAQVATAALATYGANKGYDGQQVMALLGLGAQVGVLLPFSRAQEEEADILGQRYMAAAGFNPAAAATLWQKMQSQGGGQPPVFLSSHPAPASRAQQLAQQAQRLQPVYQRARASGHTPSCSL